MRMSTFTAMVLTALMLVAECLGGSKAIPARFHLRNGRTREAFFISMVNDTVTIGIRERDGTRTVKRLPKGHFYKIELRDGSVVDLDASNYVAPSRYGTLIVRSVTFPATVFVDGMDVGKTPYRNAGMLPGDYTLEVRGKWVKPIKEPVRVVAGQTTKRLLHLERSEEWLANEEKVRQDSIRAAFQARKDSLEKRARPLESEALRPENIQKDLHALYARLVSKPSPPPVNVALVPFEVKSEAVSSDAGRIASNYGALYFTRLEGYTAIKPAVLDSALAGVSLSQIGLVPEGEVITAGRKLNAHLIVVGSVTESWGRSLFTASLVKTKTGEVIRVATAAMLPKELREFARDHRTEMDKVTGR